MRARPAPLLVTLLAAQLAAGLVAMFSQLDAISYLSEGIVAYQLAFGLLLIGAAREAGPVPGGLAAGVPK